MMNLTHLYRVYHRTDSANFLTTIEEYSSILTVLRSNDFPGCRYCASSMDWRWLYMYLNKSIWMTELYIEVIIEINQILLPVVPDIHVIPIQSC